eukprot:4514287-Amphidinium_carterae.1
MNKTNKNKKCSGSAWLERFPSELSERARRFRLLLAQLCGALGRHAVAATALSDEIRPGEGASPGSC